METYRNKYNLKYGYSKNQSHDLETISKDTGISLKGLQQIYNKGIGAYKTNPASVRPNVKSKEQWAMGRVYSAVMGGKASKIDANELKMEKGGLIAPNGKPSNLTPEQYKLVRTKAFKDWFGDWENEPANSSKVIDENGEPLVVYHGTDNEFTTFKLGYGSYSSFTENKRLALSYGHFVNSFFLSIKNPYIINGGGQYIWNVIGESQDPESFFGGSVPFSNDGIIFKDVIDFNGTLGSKYVLDVSNVIMVRKNTQIKLADGSNTTFDGNNPDIRFEDGGEVEDFISKGIVELKMFDTKPEHAKEYGFDVKNPLYVQSICISESERLKGIGKKVLDYIDEYAVSNGHDLIFGHITQKANFTKDSRHTDSCDIDLIKEFLIKGGYSTIKGNNDFYKVIKTNPDIRFDEGGNVNNNKMTEKKKTKQLIDDLNLTLEFLSKEEQASTKKLISDLTMAMEFMDDESSDAVELSELKPRKTPSGDVIFEDAWLITRDEYNKQNLILNLPKGAKADKESLKLQEYYSQITNRQHAGKVQDAIENGLYAQAIRNGQMSKERANEIIVSADLKKRFDGGGNENGGNIEQELNKLKSIPYKDFLREIQDSYKELGAEVGVKGHTKDGEPIIGYLPYQYDYMHTSDITNKKIRFFIDLGEGKLVHPSEINPKFSVSEQKRLEQTADQFYRDGLENYNTSIENLKKNQELYLVKESLSKALNNGFEIENQYDGNDYFESNGSSILVNNKNGIRLILSKYIERINGEAPKTNLSNLDLLKFKKEYLDKFEKGGYTLNEKNKIHKVMHEFKEGNLKTYSGKKVKDRKQAIAIALSEAKEMSNKYDIGGKIITQSEIRAMIDYINSTDANEFLSNSYKKVLSKFGISDIQNIDYNKFPKGEYINPYDFSGYNYMKTKNEEMGVSFLLTGEYELVSKSIFEKDYAMWLFYNYMGRINISFDACKKWLFQAQNYFEDMMPIPINLIHTPNAEDGRSYAMWFSTTNPAEASSRIGRPVEWEYDGRYYYQEIGMVGNYDFRNSGWGTMYQEKKTGLLLPEYTQTSFHFNTLMHEFAHCLDFQSQLLLNIAKYNDKQLKVSKGEINIDTRELTELEKQLYGDSLDKKPETISQPITNHFDLFIDSLISVLRASSSGNIPLTQLFEQQANYVQQTLGGVYGDLLLEQRERKRKESEMIKRDDEIRDNTRFTWQSSWREDIRDFVNKNAVQLSLKDKVDKKNKSNPYTLSEILELDNLITTFFDTEYRKILVRYPNQAETLLDNIKKMKQETNRIINNHYDNIRNNFIYGFKPSNDLDFYILNNCNVKDFKDYKSWKECAKQKV